MKLRTGLQIGAVFPILMAIFVVLGLLVRARMIENVGKVLDRSESILKTSAELNVATYDYMMAPGSVAAEQWKAVHAELGTILEKTRFNAPDQVTCIGRMRAAHVALADLFLTLSADPASKGDLTVRQREQFREIIEQLRVLTAESARLTIAGQNASANTQREIDYVVGPIFGLMALIMAWIMFATGRHIIARFASLRRAIAAVASGDFEHQIPVLGDGEIDVIASSFNAMSRQLKQTHETRGENSRQQETSTEGFRRSNMMLADALTKLKRAQAQLIDNERLGALKQMTGGVARDFNSTLTPILGLSDYMLESPQSLDDRTALVLNLKAINLAARAAREKVKHLSDFFKPIGESDTEMVDLNGVIKQAIEMLRPKWEAEASAEGRSIKISTVLDDVPSVSVNAFALKEAVSNLIINGIEAIMASGTLTVSTKVDDKIVRIMVSDTGQGMTEEMQRKCFEPFYSTKNAHHTGMGMTTVCNFFRKHGGRVDIESRVGGGTTVKAWLPLEPAPVAASRQAPEKAPETAPLRILAVDDEVWILTVLEKVLGQSGHTLTTCTDSVEALAKYKAGQFDVAVLDRAMPSMSGDELARAIKAEGRGTPVILLTGFGDIMKEKGEHPEGVDLILSKPITLDEVRQALWSVTKGSVSAANAKR